MMLGKVVGVFVCTLVAEWLWTRWSMAASAGLAVRAANSSAGLVAVGAVTTILYVGDPLYVIPAVVGAWCGTFAAVHSGR